MNSKYFFRYANSKSIVKTSIGPFIIDGKLVDNPENKNKELLYNFKSVHSQSRSNEAELQIIIESQGPRCLEDLELTEQDVIGSIDLCPSNSSPSGW